MRRQVFFCKGDDDWTNIGKPLVAWPKLGAISGFEAVDGFDEDEIYVVGWEGEISVFKNGCWKMIESPTNLILTGVVCAPDGFVYACGQHGTLIKGRGEYWELLETHTAPEDYWDVIWYEEKIYVSSLRSVYALDNGLTRIDMEDATTFCCNHLSTSGKYLCSIGSYEAGICSDLTENDVRHWFFND